MVIFTMRYNINLNIPKLTEWGLSLNEGAVFCIILDASSWTKCHKVFGEDYYLIETKIFPQELPCISDNKNTFAKIIKKLIDKMVVERKFTKGRENPVYRVTEKGKEWLNYSDQIQKGKISVLEVEKEKNPHRKGKISVSEKENFPFSILYPNTTNPNTNIMSKNEILDDTFSLFWKTYPRKEAKAQTLKIFSKYSAEKQLQIIEATKVFLETTEGMEMKFILMPTTYLNQHRYEDFVEQAKIQTIERAKSEAKSRIAEDLAVKIEKIVNYYNTCDKQMQEKIEKVGFKITNEGDFLFSDEEFDILERTECDIYGFSTIHNSQIKEMIRGAL